MENPFWKKCSSCKKEIPFSSKYYACNVSTCNGKRTGYVFCSVPCFERHLPGARHKDAFAIEEKSPSVQEASHDSAASAQAGSSPASTQSQAASNLNPTRRIIVQKNSTSGSQASANHPVPKETLIVASKLKNYIKQRADMNTSTNVMDVLSDKVRALCDEAIDKAREEGRKTVLDRDF